MQFLPTLHTIDITHIHYSDEWNLHPFLPPEQPSIFLIESIRRVGLLQPLILQKLSTDAYQLLCGRSRLRALQTTSPHKRSIACLIVAENTPPKQILSYILEDQLLSAPITAIEKSYFFSHCLKYMDSKEAAERFLPILNEKIQLYTIKRLLELLKLEREIQLSVHNSVVAEKTAYELLRLKKGDRQILHTLFIELKLGGGKQKRLLSLCKDLAYREGTSIAELVGKSEFSEIIAHPEMNQPQKATVLLANMQKMIFPQSNCAEEVFKKKITSLNLPATCTVTHALSFETDTVSLTMQFETLTELEKQLPGILNTTTNNKQLHTGLS